MKSPEAERWLESRNGLSGKRKSTNTRADRQRTEARIAELEKQLAYYVKKAR